jgi:hypothetical protein
MLNPQLDGVWMLCELECEVVELGERKEKRRREILPRLSNVILHVTSPIF